MDDDALVLAFEAATVDLAAFSHRDHIRVAFLLLSRAPAALALHRYGEALKKLAAKAGKPHAYNETMTWAYLAIVRARMESAGTWEIFVEQNPDLMTHRPSVLDAYYAPETLASPLARRVFVLPDRPARCSRVV